MTVSAGNASCAAGESVSIPITLSGNTGFSNLGIEIEYDSTALTLTNATAGQTGATYTPAQSITTNPYNMGWDSTSNNTFNGTLATLDFEIAGNTAAGNYPITVSYYKGQNGNYEDGLLKAKLKRDSVKSIIGLLPIIEKSQAKQIFGKILGGK